MKKRYPIVIMMFVCLLAFFGCSCNKEKIVNKDDAVTILKSANIFNNVKIITTTETSVNGINSVSTQVDNYYNDKYYHTSDINGTSTKTWYGYIDNNLYAFYYTKNYNSEENKSSSRVETTLLESAKKQPASLINGLFDNKGDLLSFYEIRATKKNDIYTIQINGNFEDESLSYTITINNDKISKIIKNSSIINDSIKITYDYDYNVKDIELPSTTEYPLQVNN